MNMENAATFGDIKLAFQEIWNLYKETDAKFQETDKKIQETDRQLKEWAKESAGEFKELRKTMQETDRQLRETIRATDKQIKETSKKVGKLGNRLGEFVEEMVRPGVAALFRERGIDVHSTAQNISFSDGDDRIEIDLMVQNGNEIVLVECKSKLCLQDVNDHLKRLEQFKKYFQVYANHRVMGAVAAMVIPEGIDKYAYRKGLFVLAQHGEFMQILNDDNFQPATW